ncbi:hypothetical protein EDB87DRAFT_1699793 [Lactarius vividus]|nr:hypothetical protein EDB87DRAFT_1699793 [Lactarius vividus]
MRWAHLRSTERGPHRHFRKNLPGQGEHASPNDCRVASGEEGVTLSCVASMQGEQRRRQMRVAERMGNMRRLVKKQILDVSIAKHKVHVDSEVGWTNQVITLIAQFMNTGQRHPRGYTVHWKIKRTQRRKRGALGTHPLSVPDKGDTLTLFPDGRNYAKRGVAKFPPKIRIMPGAKSDLSAATYQIHNETHTLGNVLRWMLMKNPKVEFCGYRLFSVLPEWLIKKAFFAPFLYYLNLGTDADLSAPHPSENHIQVRIQMYDNLSSLTALLGALDDLDALFESIEDAYSASLQHDDFEIWDEKR